MQSRPKQGKIFVISAVSGAGKTTISNKLLELYHDAFNISKVVTYTSRPQRQGEIDGKDYHFLSLDEFNKLNNEGFFLETTEYAGNFYGSPASIIDDLTIGKSFLIITDRPGALHFKTLIPGAVLIWIFVQDIDTIRQRLILRNSESSKQLEKRLFLAEQETASEKQSPMFDYHVKNDKVDQAVAQIHEIIKAALT
jgi:guanylate kinase